MTAEQIKSLEAPFASNQVKQREGSFGQVLDYLEGHAVIQRLNEVLGGKWSFEVIEYQIREDSSEVFVLGKLTSGGVAKTQFGSSRIIRHKQTGEIISLADDLKAAATDALKKCATLLGVGLYLYNGDSKPTAGNGSSAEKPAGPALAPPTASRAQNNGPVNGGHDKSRLTAKQLQLIHKLMTENSLSKEDLDVYCRKIYGRVIDFLTKADASRLIETLFSGNLTSGNNAA